MQHPGFEASHTNAVPPHQPQGESRVSPGEDASGMDTSTQHVEQQLGTNDQPQNLQSLQRSSDQHEKECDAVSDSAIEMWCCSESEKRMKRTQPPPCRDSEPNQRQKKRRRHSVGIDRDTWCFGPDSCSTDKIGVHIGVLYDRGIRSA